MSTHKSYCKIDVVEPQDNPVYKFTLYKLLYRSMDDGNNFEVIVYKRFSELKKLYDQMYSIHLNLFRINPFPTFVKANFFDRFDREIIENRRKSSEELLNFICENKYLYNHKIFKDFINSGFKKSIVTENNLFDNNLESINDVANLPTPILPVSLLPHQRKSLSDSSSNDFENVFNSDKIISKSTSSLDNLSDNEGYLEAASTVLHDAEKMEIENCLDLALKYYENAIEILLKGVKLDQNKSRVILVHKQIKLYLDKAEMLKKTYLKNDQSNEEDALLKLLDQCVVLKSSNNNKVM